LRSEKRERSNVRGKMLGGEESIIQIFKDLKIERLKD